MKDENRSLEGKSAEKQFAVEIDEQLEVAEKAYQLLQDTVREWQAEDHPDLSQWKPEHVARPYFTLGNLPEEPVLELWQQLNERVGIHMTAKELAEVLKEFKAGQNPADEELLTRLYFAFSGVATWLRERLPEAAVQAATEGWKSAVCPICGEDSRFSVLVEPVGKRELYCRVCGHTWPSKRVGCIVCGSENASNQTYLNSPEFPGLQIAVCEECGEYFKEIDLRTRAAKDLVWEDVRTLPLNFAAEQWLQAKKGQAESGKGVKHAIH